MFILLLFIIPYIISFFLMIILSIFLKRKSNISNKKQKITFTFTGAFLYFPALMPAGTISVIPVPFISGLFLSGNIFEWIEFSSKMFFFTIPSFLITALIFRGIAAIIFYNKTPRTDDRNGVS